MEYLACFYITRQPNTFVVAACETQNVNVTVLPSFDLSEGSSVTAKEIWGKMAQVKVIAATNLADIFYPALMRSGWLDHKIEFPHPTEERRARIMQIYSRKMNAYPYVNFEELARSTNDFNRAQLKAVCMEAGMLALRLDATEVKDSCHDFLCDLVIVFISV
uniref:26S proteasome regulatory subunit 6A homolog n=1 Tax=Tanacetum cinerariifolium TaxID=118510 RepID=A0A6L2L0T5_TANCI|nr:26S proteasome regulatory subunit 6A homolog [Tanacetum cinerariifolium]